MKPLSYLLPVVALTFSSAPIAAQQTLPPAKVTLIAGMTPSKGARTEVVRQAQRLPQNVVIVDRNASAADLAAALAMVNALRLQHGDSLSHDFRARPDHVTHGEGREESAYRKWLNEQLVRLRSAPERDLQPFGVVKTVRITLPPPTGTVTTAGTGR
jgi:hypothetical protein